jgi:SAM-dependent methyltransferase
VSALTEYYRSKAYFDQLIELARDGNSGVSRELALMAVLDAAPVGLDILDLGCGLGGFSRRFQEGNRVTGVDVNPMCLDWMTRRWGCAAVQLDIEEAWPIRPASFDLVLMGDVLEHLFTSVSTLAKASTALRPGGRIAVAVPNVGYWKRRLRLLMKGELAKDAGEHIRHFSPSSMARIAQRAGLQTVAYRSYAWNRGGQPRVPLSFAWGFVALLTHHEGGPGVAARGCEALLAAGRCHMSARRKQCPMVGRRTHALLRSPRHAHFADMYDLAAESAASSGGGPTAGGYRTVQEQQRLRRWGSRWAATGTRRNP